MDFHKAGIGVILRDKSGEVLMADSKVESNQVEHPKVIVLLALFRGLQLCSMSISSIIVESDCLLLIQSLQQIKIW